MYTTFFRKYLDFITENENANYNISFEHDPSYSPERKVTAEISPGQGILLNKHGERLKKIVIKRVPSQPRDSVNVIEEIVTEHTNGNYDIVPINMPLKFYNLTAPLKFKDFIPQFHRYTMHRYNVEGMNDLLEKMFDKLQTSY